MRKKSRILGDVVYFINLFSWIFFLCTNTQAQSDCSSERYKDDLFDIQVTQEPAIYATAPDIPSVYLGEGTTFPQDLSFDFYEPLGDTILQRPLIVLAFGGAFLGGDKRQAELVSYCEALTKKGFCVASIDYRIHFNIFSTSSSIRAVYRGLQDFRAAIRYFRHHASTYKIDPEHIYGGGNSAGAINAIHAAYVDEIDRTPSSIFGATFENGNTPDLGCIDCSGNSLMESGVPNAVVNLWGGIGETFWMESGEAPIISFHGLDDTTVSPHTAPPFGFPIFPALNGSVPMHAQADLVGIYNELHTYPGEGHELWTDLGLASEILDESADFVQQLLSPLPPVIEGALLVCSDSTYRYFIRDAESNSTFCWELHNGIIIASDEASVTVQWHTGVTGSLQVIELNFMNAQGQPVNLEVNIDPLPVANFNFEYTGSSNQFYQYIYRRSRISLGFWGWSYINFKRSNTHF